MIPKMIRLHAASLRFLLGAFFLQPFQAAGAGAGTTDLSTLPWDDLRASLSQNASLIETGPTDYVSQCLPVFPLADEDRSHYDLVDQPSGTCMNQLYCGFKRCNPVAHETDLSILEKWERIYGAAIAGNVDLVNVTDLDNPSYNVPNYVLFPAVAGDVHAAVSFAKEHGIELSVKNSGHSYTGASSKADTLHLNMNHYRRYSNAELVDCVVADDGTGAGTADSDPSLAKQPCRLALARNKEAALRIGGGENWDKVYGAVKDWNEARPDGYKYLVVGGAAGTVSPMGWTWQAGLSGTTNGRTNGFGVDQVLQIEMVLPLGHHVKFGPVEWEEAEGYRYPRTTKVEGVCNSNPMAAESEWVWEPCADPTIDFDGLWFAQNGGGGGSYGIVTSIQVQLNEYFPLTTFVFGSGELASSCGIAPEEILSAPLGNTIWEFVIDFFLDPSTLGISDTDSDKCGAPALIATVVLANCYGDGADIFLSAWKKYIADRNQTLIDAGVSPASIETAANCFDYGVESFADYAESNALKDGPHTGKAKSNPKPSYTSTTEGAVNVLIPTKWIIENKAKVAAWVNEGSVDGGVVSVTAPSAYLAFGGGTAIAHDQANSLSDAHRSAGMMLFFPHTFLDETFWTETFPEMYPAVVDGSDNFPAFVGSNHAGPNTRGPTRDDWTKPCRLDWTEEERDARCVPLQEAIWGTENLARLEAVKDAVDPNGMLNCYGCVGNNRRRDAETLAPTSAPAETTLAPTVAPAETLGDSAGWKQAIPSIGSVILGTLASFLFVASSVI